MSCKKKMSILWALSILPAAAAGLLLWALWYRNADHAAKLLARRSSLVKVEERVLADSAECRRVAFVLTDKLGRVTRGELRLPSAMETRHPAVLIFGGLDTGARAAGLVTLKRDAVLCAMDYPAYQRGKPGLFELPGRLLSYDEAVFDAVGMAFAVLDYLCSRPEVDTTRLTVVGASFGVPFAVILAALDYRVKGLVLLHGAADLEMLIERNLEPKIKSRFLRKTAGLVLGTFTAPFEPSAYIGRLAGRPLLMVNSRTDRRIPPECVKLLYFQAEQPKDLIWLDSEHLHPSNRRIIDSLTGITSDWLVKKNLL